MSAPARAPWTVLGACSHAEALARQEATRARVIAGELGAEEIFLAWHPPTITLGKHADAGHVRLGAAELAARGLEVVRTTRGGEATVHGPGQLLVYPVVRLRHGVIDHVCMLGRAVVDELAALGVDGAEVRREPVGVFVGERKIAAIGLHVSRRVAIHGLALNVTREVLPLFETIVPCGAPSQAITSIESELAARGATTTLELADLAARIGARLASVLHLRSHCGSIG